MLNATSLVLVTTAVMGSPTYPDALDTLRGADTLPQIQLIMDDSGSMNTTLGTLNCPWYTATHKGGNTTYSRLDTLKAALVGCQTAFDGILSIWSGRAMFALRTLNGGLTTNGGFDTSMGNTANLINDVLGMAGGGCTPVGTTYYAGARYQIDHFAYDGNLATAQCAPTASGFGAGCNNTLECRQNYMVVLSDGDSNGPSITMDFVAGQPNQAANDLYVGCSLTANPAPLTDLAARYLVQDVTQPPGLGALVDVDADVAGNQQIRTYTIAFAAPASAQALLTSMALEGDGLDFNATDYGSLANAFQQIILSIVARSNVAFAPGTIQNDGLFSGNTAYVTSFRPFDRGFWYGTTKKYCVDPTYYAGGPGSTACMFLRTGGVANGALLVNPTPTDLWSGTNAQIATTGGTGYRLLLDMGQTPGFPPVAPYYSNRDIVTWNPGTGGWIDVNGPAFRPASFMYVSGACARARLINKLYGYTDDAVGVFNNTNCSAPGNADPRAVGDWPIGDTPNGSTSIVRYADNCDVVGNCFLAVNANDSMLHLYDTANGREIFSIVPGHAWGEDLYINEHRMRDIMDQPNFDRMRRFMFDGEMRVYHDDRNGNGNIDGTETAYLIAGLGRGGKQYIRFDASAGSSFRSSLSSDNFATFPAPQPLMFDTDTSFRNLRNTWNVGWLGKFRDTRTQTVMDTMIFPSGHDPSQDINTTNFGALQGQIAQVPTGNVINSAPSSVGILPQWESFQMAVNYICAQAGALICPTVTACTPCTTVNPPGDCSDRPLDLLTGIPVPLPCYDWQGWAAIPNSPITNLGGGSGFTLPFGPFSSPSTDAYQIVFDLVQLGPNDYLSIRDNNGNEVIRYTGPGPYPSYDSSGNPVAATSSPTTPWIYDSAFQFVVVTDGVDDLAAAVWDVNSVNRILNLSPGVLSGDTYPSLYIVDLARWNVGSGAADTFSSRPTNSRQADALVARITANCDTGNTTLGSTEVCYDLARQGADDGTNDLQYMTCPIVAAPTIFSEGGIFRTAYFGDTCGQIWAVSRDPTDPSIYNSLQVRRLAVLNNTDGSGFVQTGNVKDVRAIFTKVDVVVSTCTGGRRIGVYYGTGGEQRPALDEYLRNATITTPPTGGPWVTSWPPVVPGPDAGGGLPDRDVFGVVWDDGNTRNVRIENMIDVSTIDQVDFQTGGNAAGAAGYFIRGGRNEKVLSDPLVIDSVAYFKTYTPTRFATECVSAEGVDRVYAFNNCTAQAIVDPGNNGYNYQDRSVSGPTPSDGGGNLLVYTPPEGGTYVVPPKPGPTDPPVAMLPTNPNQRLLRFYQWRLNVDPTF